MGIPAQIVRELTTVERQLQIERALTYVDTARAHAASSSFFFNEPATTESK